MRRDRATPPTAGRDAVAKLQRNGKSSALLEILLLLATAAFIGPADRAEAENFEGDSAAKLEQRWSFLQTGGGPPGDWSSIAEHESRTKENTPARDTHNKGNLQSDKPKSANHVLAQQNDSNARDRTLLAVLKEPKFANVRISARIRIVDGDREQSAGVVWRVKDKNNYLLARIDAKDERVRLYRVVNGNRIRFGGTERIEIKRGQWYLLRIDHVGDKIKCYVDDDIMALETDRHYRNAGRVGFWTKSDSVAHFDDLKVTPLPK